VRSGVGGPVHGAGTVAVTAAAVIPRCVVAGSAASGRGRYHEDLKA
jgi:hypothetical protein